jgi:polysaccharide biosynthesis protein PslH
MFVVMNVLFVVPYAPNLVRVRAFQLISNLVRQGHDLTVATLWTTAEEQADLQRLKDRGPQIVSRRLTKVRAVSNCLRAVPTKAPLQAVYCWQPELASDLTTTSAGLRVQHYDVIHVEHLRGAHYGLWLKKHLSDMGGAARPPIVWDAVDCISHLFSQAAQKSRSLQGRLMTRLELGRTQRYEGWLLSQFEQVTVTSPVDKKALEALWQANGARRNHQSPDPSGPRWLSVLPNGVDLGYFTPGEEPRDPATIVLSGKMSYHANVSAALHLVNDIMPRVWAVNPAARVVIAGKDPTHQIRQLALQHAGRVEVTGSVPDIRPYLRRATVAVVPVLYSAGIQNKVLEAMACATPVIASPQAISALAAHPGSDLAVAGDEASFAANILALLSDPTQQAQIGQAGRAYVERQHSWRTVTSQLESVYHRALEAQRGSAGAVATPYFVARPESVAQPAGRP